MKYKCESSKIWNESNFMKIVFVRNKNCSYLTVPDNDRTYQLNNKTYDLSCTNIKIVMTITIWIYYLSMHCCIIMQNKKQFNRFKDDRLSYLNYDNDCFNNEKHDFNVLIMLGI